MRVERDLEGIALPFAAGVLSAIYAAEIFCRAGISQMTVSACLLAVILILMHPGHTAWNGMQARIVIGAVMLFCGLWTGMSGHRLQSCHGDPVGLLAERAEIIGMHMQAAIDRIPFARKDTSAIIKALLTGERSAIPSEVTVAFRESGASHILALSGFHLGIIYGIVTKTLVFIGNSPAAIKARSLLTVVLCTFYTLATGAGPSIARALIFITLGECARLAGRYRSTRSVLLAALTIQLTVSPASVSDPGFQLSYAAMGGIAFVFPWLKGFWPESGPSHSRNPLRRMWNSAAMSISCQLTTGPLAWIYFHSFPKHFLLTNMIALPLAGLIIPTAIATLVLNQAGLCPEILIKATETLVQALSAALDIISCM